MVPGLEGRRRGPRRRSMACCGSGFRARGPAGEVVPISPTAVFAEAVSHRVLVLGLTNYQYVGPMFLMHHNVSKGYLDMVLVFILYETRSKFSLLNCRL